MSDELKKCPFCGKLGGEEILMSGGELIARCLDRGCIGHSIISIADDWNTRPIEDTLRKQLEIAVDGMIAIRNRAAVNLVKTDYELIRMVDSALAKITRRFGKW